jgi:hypothetical protein
LATALVKEAIAAHGIMNEFFQSLRENHYFAKNRFPRASSEKNSQ